MTTTVKIICAPMPDPAMWIRSRNAITYQAESFGGTVTIEEGHKEVVIAVSPICASSTGLPPTLPIVPTGCSA